MVIGLLVDDVVMGPDDVGVGVVGFAIGDDEGGNVGFAFVSVAVGEGVGAFDSDGLVGLKVGSFVHLKKIYVKVI